MVAPMNGPHAMPRNDSAPTRPMARARAGPSKRWPAAAVASGNIGARARALHDARRNQPVETLRRAGHERANGKGPRLKPYSVARLYRSAARPASGMTAT